MTNLLRRIVARLIQKWMWKQFAIAQRAGVNVLNKDVARCWNGLEGIRVTKGVARWNKQNIKVGIKSLQEQIRKIKKIKKESNLQKK